MIWLLILITACWEFSSSSIFCSSSALISILNSTFFASLTKSSCGNSDFWAFTSFSKLLISLNNKFIFLSICFCSSCNSSIESVNTCTSSVKEFTPSVSPFSSSLVSLPLTLIFAFSKLIYSLVLETSNIEPHSGQVYSLPLGLWLTTSLCCAFNSNNNSVASLSLPCFNSSWVFKRDNLFSFSVTLPSNSSLSLLRLVSEICFSLSSPSLLFSISKSVACLCSSLSLFSLT